ncbi:MAG: hypothetical protein HEEMFOPI_01724 [Holosporales bacterium]
MLFIILAFSSFSLSASTLNLENSPISIPISFKPYLEAFRWAVEEDENGVSLHTLREIKDSIDPIKDNFFNLIKDPKLLTYYETLETTAKEFETTIDRRRKFLSSSKTVAEKMEFAVNLEEIRCESSEFPKLPLSFEPEVNLENLRTYEEARFSSYQRIGNLLRQNLTEEEMILLDISTALGTIADGFEITREQKCEYRDFSRPIIAAILNLPKDILDQYCSLSLQKMLFPFYMMESFQIIYNCSNLIFDCVKEGYYSMHSDERPTFDVSDKLDKPFFEAFDVMHEKVSSLCGCSRERLLENFLFILNNHVEFVPFFEDEK